jgi:3-demethylubiquinone-9 3-methyltransferase
MNNTSVLGCCAKTAKGKTIIEIKQKIVSHLWFDKEAKEAADFYCSVFPDSRIRNTTMLVIRHWMTAKLCHLRFPASR